jgi:hypothetical protein
VAVTKENLCAQLLLTGSDWTEEKKIAGAPDTLAWLWGGEKISLHHGAQTDCAEVTEQRKKSFCMRSSCWPDTTKKRFCARSRMRPDSPQIKNSGARADNAVQKRPKKNSARALTLHALLDEIKKRSCCPKKMRALTLEHSGDQKILHGAVTRCMPDCDRTEKKNWTSGRQQRGSDRSIKKKMLRDWKSCSWQTCADRPARTDRSETGSTGPLCRFNRF